MQNKVEQIPSSRLSISRRRPFLAGPLQFTPVLAPAACLAQTFVGSIPSPNPFATVILASCVPYIGGLGYLYLGRWKRFLLASLTYSSVLAAAAYLALGVDGDSAAAHLHAICIAWGLATTALSFCLAADAIRFARAANIEPSTGGRLGGSPPQPPSGDSPTGRSSSLPLFVVAALVPIAGFGYFNFIGLLLVIVSINCNLPPRICL